MFLIKGVENFPISSNFVAPAFKIKSTGVGGICAFIDAAPVNNYNEPEIIIMSIGWLYNIYHDLEIENIKSDKYRLALNKDIDISTTWFGNNRIYLIDSSDNINLNLKAEIKAQISLPVLRNTYQLPDYIVSRFMPLYIEYEGYEVDVNVHKQYYSQYELPSGEYLTVGGVFDYPSYQSTLGVVKIQTPPGIDLLDKVEYFGNCYTPLDSIYSIKPFRFYWHSEIDYALLFVPLYYMRSIIPMHQSQLGVQELSNSIQFISRL